MAVEWFEDAVVYQIFIDRFAGFDSTDNWHNPEFVGGDIKGITEKLDYLEELGIDVIWISPFYENEAYHGYHITDYFSVDERFGTEEDLKELIEEVHERDMKIIADFVPNHCSTEHPYFKDAQSNPASDYKDWFYFEDWPDDYIGFLDFESELAKINLENQEAREHIIQAAEKWLELGLDGYRLDHVIGPSNDFWEEFNAEIKEEYPDTVLIGEAWWSGIGFKHLETFEMDGKLAQALTGSQELLQRKYIGLMNGVLDFKARETMLKNINSSIVPGFLYGLMLKIHYALYPGDFSLPNFLDNHDTNRALYRLGNDKEKLKKAFKKLLKTDQPTVIYYGTEIGMTQHQAMSEFEAHGDLQARQPMQWHNRDDELLEFFKEEIGQ